MTTATQQQTISLAHSPDSDDAFMFYGLATHKIETGDLEFTHVLKDIQTLNEIPASGSSASEPLVKLTRKHGPPWPLRWARMIWSLQILRFVAAAMVVYVHAVRSARGLSIDAYAKPGCVANFAQAVVKGQVPLSVGGIRQPESRTVRPQCGPRFPPRSPAVVS